MTRRAKVSSETNVLNGESVQGGSSASRSFDSLGVDHCVGRCLIAVETNCRDGSGSDI